MSVSHRIDDREQERAMQILRANCTARHFRLHRLEQYVEGSQYEGRPTWWDDSVPLFDRAPCVVWPVADDAIQSYVDLVLGSGRFPTITSAPGDETVESDDDLLLTEDEAETLDRGIVAALKQTRGQAVLSEMLESAQGCGTAVVIGCIRHGKLCLETVVAKWCTREVDPERPGVTTRLEIRYPYLEEYFDAESRKWVLQVLLYRRVIDAEADVTYKPAVANEHGNEPARWVERTRVEHGLGFCPVVWYRHMAKCGTASEDDGHALHEHLLDELDALNFAISQRHRASLYASDPQLVETGVDADVQPGPGGIHPQSVSAYARGGSPQIGGDKAIAEAANSAWRSPGVPVTSVGTAGVRKKGPGVIYRYPSKDSKLTLLTLPGDALDAATSNADAIMTLLREGLAYVATDPESMKLSGELSGRFMEWLYRKQINRCDRIRVDFGDLCLLPVVHMLLRIIMMRAKGLHMPGVAKVAAILPRFMREVEQADGALVAEWFPPELTLKWGAYFPATEADQKARGENVRADLDAGIITTKDAVEAVARYYNIESVDEHMEALAKEAEEKAATLHDAQARLAESAEASDPEDDEVEPPGVPGERAA